MYIIKPVSPGCMNVTFCLCTSAMSPGREWRCVYELKPCHLVECDFRGRQVPCLFTYLLECDVMCT